MPFHNYVEAFCSLVSEECTHRSQWSIFDHGINHNDSLYNMFVQFLEMQKEHGQIDLERAFLSVICVLNRFLECSGIFLTQSNVMCISTISLFLYDKLINDFYQGLDYWCYVNQYNGESMLKQELLFFSTVNYDLTVSDDEINQTRNHLHNVYNTSCLSPLVVHVYKNDGIDTDMMPCIDRIDDVDFLCVDEAIVDL